jgi:hypothetical protein
MLDPRRPAESRDAPRLQDRRAAAQEGLGLDKRSSLTKR